MWTALVLFIITALLVTAAALAVGGAALAVIWAAETVRDAVDECRSSRELERRALETAARRRIPRRDLRRR